MQAAFTELGLDADWIGMGNREDLTYPVLQLRQFAQRIGLLRKYRGQLVATALGRALRDDPVGLWRHIAERISAGSSDRSSDQAGLLQRTGSGLRRREQLSSNAVDFARAALTARDQD